MASSHRLFLTPLHPNISDIHSLNFSAILFFQLPPLWLQFHDNRLLSVLVVLHLVVDYKLISIVFTRFYLELLPRIHHTDWWYYLRVFVLLKQDSEHLNPRWFLTCRDGCSEFDQKSLFFLRPYRPLWDFHFLTSWSCLLAVTDVWEFEHLVLSVRYLATAWWSEASISFFYY